MGTPSTSLPCPMYTMPPWSHVTLRQSYREELAAKMGISWPSSPLHEGLSPGPAGIILLEINEVLNGGCFVSGPKETPFPPVLDKSQQRSSGACEALNKKKHFPFHWKEGQMAIGDTHQRSKACAGLQASSEPQVPVTHCRALAGILALLSSSHLAP